eukprot:TRINITY_DN22271_c0_g1_i1.p1 TRINITY_DN22271_c0_g1~~TRINITY_DN22271_c0_g1_i1.p1  ORF type:complete len:148 (-),score=46.68 TRINITY_DN22271_c0_g1_i1:275-718(-)
MSEKVLFEDIFKILARDPEGKKFDKVSRYVCRSEQFEMDLILDINVDIYPLKEGEKFALALASTLNLDGTPDEGVFDQSGRKTLADKYEYVMYGKLYKFTGDDDDDRNRVEMYISFGGLLLKIGGDPNNLKDLQLDQRLYLLMRKVS